MAKLELKYITANGVKLAYFEQGEPDERKPTLFFVHATGFHARLWDYQIEAFPDHHVISLDQRGHGRSEKVAAANWHEFGQDQAAFVDALGLRNLIGIGHSMGAHCMIECASLSDRFQRLLLLDPTVASPEAYAEFDAAEYGDMLHPAAKRRANYDSAEDMMSALQEKSSFPLFHPRIFADYCQYGVEPSDDGGVRLCCEPEIEARVYMGARSNPGIYDHVRALKIPVTVVRAQVPKVGGLNDWAGSPTWPGLHTQFSNSREIHWPNCTHFIPMQEPDKVIELIRAEIDQWHPQ